jgi:hypothetical protein
MDIQNIMNKIRQFDNLCASWMMRHFYIIFFEIILVVIAGLFFYTNITTVVLPAELNVTNNVEHLLIQQVTNTRFILILMLLNSFWMLYIFSGMNRLRSTLKDINFNLSRRRYQKPS